MTMARARGCAPPPQVAEPRAKTTFFARRAGWTGARIQRFQAYREGRAYGILPPRGAPAQRRFPHMIGIIGGTGLYRMEGLEVTRSSEIDTPFGRPSGPVHAGPAGGAGDRVSTAAWPASRPAPQRDQLPGEHLGAEERGRADRSSASRRWGACARRSVPATWRCRRSTSISPRACGRRASSARAWWRTSPRPTRRAPTRRR